MGKVRRGTRKKGRAEWPRSDSFQGFVDLHVLPSVAAINGARIREITGDDSIPDTTQIVLNAYRAVVGERTFHVGFCIGDGERFSPVGLMVLERLMMEKQGGALHVVPVVHEDVAWDIVLNHLTSFSGETLLFAFPDSDVYDAGTAKVSYSKRVRKFDDSGAELRRLTAAERRQIRAQKAAILNRPPPPTLYAAPGIEREELPWIFRFVTPAGKVVRTAVWNGRRDYAHELPRDFTRWVGGDKIAVVQVDSPVGINRRSSLNLTHSLSEISTR